MRRQYLLLFAAPLVLLAGCASDPAAKGSVELSEAPATTSGASPYGLFLAGEAAFNDGRSSEAAQFFARAHGEVGDEAMISDRAFTAAVLSGDITRAAAIAPTGEEASDSAKRLGHMVRGVEYIAQGKGKLAMAEFAPDQVGFLHRGVANMLAPWAAAQAGDVERSLIRPEMRNDKIVEYFGQLGQAMLYERARKYDEAETDFKALTSANAPVEMATLGYGAFLERRGRRPEAIALYDEILARDPGSDGLKAARARAATRKPAPPMLTIREGAAQALLAPAAAMLGAKQDQIALAYLRMILRLDPNRNDAWLMVGDVMTGAGDAQAAREAYSKPKPGSPDFAAARAKLAWSYQGEDNGAEAVRLAREAASGGDTDARLTLADLLRANEQYAESSEILTTLLTENPKADWRLYYARGVAYEKLDRWEAAEADLEMALKLRPDEPELLNYLGYSWIDRGVRLKEALEMVERAVASNPKSGAMVDSLGWAHYRMGDYKSAVAKLEEAVELDAGDPDINNHLGDAYWRVGRRDEALFQWRRVLTLEPDAKIKANAEAKIASGLGPDGPAAAPKVAGQ